jgi:CRP-like cAMP-binding protein
MRAVPVANLLIAGLSRKDCRDLVACGEEVTLAAGELLCEAGSRPRHAWFPHQAVIAMESPGEGRASVLALVGREGMVGVPAVLGVDEAPLRAMVQGDGGALRVDTAALRRALAASPTLRARLLRYAHVAMADLAQGAICMHFHSLDQRLARWLLTTRDRLDSPHFHLTQERLGLMLGVRRVGVTNAAGLLQERRLLHYSRGDIAIVDGAGLEAASCSCYRRCADTWGRVMG